MNSRFVKIASMFLLFVCLVSLVSCKKDDTTAEREALGRALARSVASEAYTPASYESYMSSYQSAERVYQDSDADIIRLTAAFEGLEKAYAALVLRADLTELKALMEETHNEEDYTVESYADYRSAWNKAASICENPESKQMLVDSARDVLAAAIAALESKSDTAELASLLATPIPDTGYTTLSYTRYMNILAEATELFSRRKDDMNKSQAAEYAQDVYLCTNELREAIESLVKKGDPANLQKTLEETKKAYTEKSVATMNKDPKEYYTEETYEALMLILEQAEAMLETDDYGQEEYDDYEENILKACEALTVRCDTSALESVILEATVKYLGSPDSYSTDSYIALNNEVNAGKDLLRAHCNDQTQLDAAELKILQTIAKLVQISLPADGKTDHSFDGVSLNICGASTALGSYFRDPISYLGEMSALQNAGKLQILNHVGTGETELLLETDNGIRVELCADSVKIYLREDGVATSDEVKIAGVRLGLDPMQVGAILGAPTEEQIVNGERLHTYKDAASGISLFLRYGKGNGVLSEMEVLINE